MMWLLVATSVHLGFQLTITMVAYPGLLNTPDAQWTAAHTAHGRRIVPLVAVIYAALVVTVLAALVTDPSPAVVAAALACTVAAISTAAVAAPTHGRLGHGRTPALVHRLRIADVIRTAAAGVAVGSTVVAALS